MKKTYIILLLLITIAVNIVVFAQQSKETFSETEQRYLTHLEPLTWPKWVDGQVQRNIEATYIDNFYQRNEIIDWLQQVNTKLSFIDYQLFDKLISFQGSHKTIGTIENTNSDSQEPDTLVNPEPAKPEKKFYSVPLADAEVSYVKELNRLIKTPEAPNEERLATVKSNINKIKMVEQRYPQVDFYVYLPLFLNDLPYFDITGTSAEYIGLFKTQLDHFACSKYNSLENALDSYFLTDHHWNHIGGKKGYEEIISLIYGDTVKPREPIEVVDFNDVTFYGYLARRIEYSIDISDTISKVVYDLPQMKIYYNGEPQEQYGRLDLYKAKKFSTDRGTDHYASLYHPREAEIVFERNNENLDNILIFADSFSNINRDVLASHFNKTIFISPGLFKDKYGAFNSEVFEKYLADNQITKVLFMSSLISYYDIGDIKVLFEDMQS